MKIGILRRAGLKKFDVITRVSEKADEVFDDSHRELLPLIDAILATKGEKRGTGRMALRIRNSLARNALRPAKSVHFIILSDHRRLLAPPRLPRTRK